MTMPFQPAAFPYARPRRLRSQPWVRRLVAETTLTPADLIWPIIVHDGAEDRQAVASMPGVFRLSPREAAKAAVEARDLGIPMIALFPNVNDSLKDTVGTAASDRRRKRPHRRRRQRPRRPDPRLHQGHQGRRARYRRHDRRGPGLLHRPRP